MQNDLRNRTAETTRSVQAWATRLVDQVPVLSGVNAEQREKFETLVERLRTETEQVLKNLPLADQVEQLVADVQGRLPATRAEVADLEARVAEAEKTAQTAKKAAAKKPATRKACAAKKPPASTAKKAAAKAG